MHRNHSRRTLAGHLSSRPNSPHFGSDGQIPSEKAERSGKTDARQSRAARRQADARCPRQPAEPRHRPRHRRPGSGTGLQQPPDNSWDRRRDFSEAHKARKSTPKEFNEAPQRDYSASPITGLDPALAQELGLGDDDDASSPSPAGGGSRAEGERGGVSGAKKIYPLPPSGACHRAALRADPLGRRPPPSRGR